MEDIPFYNVCVTIWKLQKPLTISKSVVFHRVCLDQVCFRSDDAKLYVKIIIFLFGLQDGCCRRAILQQYGSSHTDSQRLPGIAIMMTPFVGQHELKQ